LGDEEEEDGVEGVLLLLEELVVELVAEREASAGSCCQNAVGKVM